MSKAINESDERTVVLLQWRRWWYQHAVVTRRTGWRRAQGIG
jgi:hypothetical protein